MRYVDWATDVLTSEDLQLWEWHFRNLFCRPDRHCAIGEVILKPSDVGLTFKNARLKAKMQFKKEPGAPIDTRAFDWNPL
jgi:hypothetical protein